MQTQLRASFLVWLLGLGLTAGSAFGQTGSDDADVTLNDPVFVVDQPKSDLRIVEKFAKILKLEKRITTVSGFDQAVINVSKVDRSPNMIRVHAEAPGVTSLIITDEDNRNYTLDVFVIGDVRHLQAYLNRLFPHSSIRAVAIRDTVVLRGWVTQPEHITEIREIAGEFYGKVIDQMKVGGVQQVQLKVRVLEVQRGKIRRLGFNFLFSNNDGVVASTPGQLTSLETLGATAATVTGLADPTVAFSLVNDDALFQGFLEALKEESLLKILAEPKLVTTNGRPANMLAGGEFPVLVPQSLGTTTIEWRQFGVRLQAVPIILGRGRVRLELEPEVSERDFTNAVNLNGLLVPGLTTRRVNTQVEMRFGETFMIAGLLSMRTTAQTSKIPLLGELPWVGAAFRRVRYEETETELVIMVTPELVSPMKSGQVPAGGPGQFTDAPVDRELYIDGVMEVPRFGPRCQGCGTGHLFQPGYAGGSQLEGISPLVTPSRVIRTTPVQIETKAPSTRGPSLPTPPQPGTNAASPRTSSARQPGMLRRTSRTSFGSSSRRGLFSRLLPLQRPGRTARQNSFRGLFSGYKQSTSPPNGNRRENGQAGRESFPGLIRPQQQPILPTAGNPSRNY